MPSPWIVRWEPKARKALADIPHTQAERILRAIATLATDPYGARNVKALTGGGYRLRVGDWRVVYALVDAELVVVVVRIGHRREVYR